MADKESENYKEDAVFVDGTLGTAGHTLAMLREHPTCRVIAFDRDADSMKFAKKRLESEHMAQRVTLVHGDFRFAPSLLQPFFDNLKVGSDGRPIERIDGALVDAGMSLFQVSWAERGISFRADGPLDMRYDRSRGPKASDLVNELSPKELEDLFFKFTDERWARRITTFITDQRRRHSITTTHQLAQIVEEAIPVGVRAKSRSHPATQVFAALRLAVNDEFWALDSGTSALAEILAPSARLVVLTYSSTEDRTVKRSLRRLALREGNSDVSLATPRTKRRLVRPASEASSLASELALDLPFERPESLRSPPPAGLGTSWKLRITTPKPVVPTDAEIASNPLARSCKLRAGEKILL